ncbi:hypothetical protein ABXT64_12365 [Candidatus Marifrigoribacter sp. Uisw_064]|jgi:hypothetical protein|uniref:hypothetical protein n=1 Tax=Candidatus Marifrigoribacter sp. Uisw_064 TaxID=3230970 RepID=UPI003D53B8FA
MKILKFSLIAFTLIFMSCSSDDESSDTPDPIQYTPNITLEVEEIILRANGADITDLVSFGQPSGVPTSDFLIELNQNDCFKLGIPEGLGPNDTFYYRRLDFFENDIELDGDTIGSLFALDIPEEGDEIPNPDVNDPGTNIFKVCTYQAIGVAPIVDIDLKYDVIIYIKRNDDFFGPYTIDPKIRIKSRN